MPPAEIKQRTLSWLPQRVCAIYTASCPVLCCHPGSGRLSGGRWQDAVGLAEVVLPAVERLRIEVRRRCNLQLQLYKTFLFCWEGGLPPGTPADVELAGEIVQGTFRCGFVCFGCPVCEDKFVSHKLMKVADRIVTDMGKAVDLLTGDRQAVWTTLRALPTSLVTGANWPGHHWSGQWQHS